MTWQDDALCKGRPEWTAPIRAEVTDLVEACSSCPVLRPCRRYALGHRWAGVVIGGWHATEGDPKRPPWHAP